MADYCFEDGFYAECPAGEILIIEEAKYGRMQLGKCIKLDLGYMNCQR